MENFGGGITVKEREGERNKTDRHRKRSIEPKSM